jgi:HEAT repeat protein
MKNRRITVAILACFFAVCGFTFFFIVNREPSYQGRSLSDWLIAAMKTSDTNLYVETQVAIKQMGPKAAPYLVSWLTYEPSDLKRRILKNLPWEVEDRKQDRAMVAEWALVVLGGDAKPAVPELTRLLNAPTEDNRPLTVAKILGQLDVLGKPALKEAIVSTNSSMRHRALFGIPSLGTNATDLIPYLMNALNDPDPHCRREAAIALKRLKANPEPVLLILTTNLADVSPDRRSAALHGLAVFRERSTPALPQITNLLNDRNGFVRSAAADAIKRITSSTNAPKVE